MPFKSLSQRKKFYALKNEGKMSQSTIDEWEKNTPKNLPERITKKAEKTTDPTHSDEPQSPDNIAPEAKTASFTRGFMKTAGGPGSGVMGNNTSPISFLKTSPLISIGKRKSFLDSHEPLSRNEMVSTKRIIFKGQEKMVPKKVVHFLLNFKEVLSKPVDLLEDENLNLHIIDGHHRCIAAMLLKKKQILANIYKA
jgi:hypothetical protein